MADSTDRTISYQAVGILPKLVLTALRIAIGWHFLYEGIAKLFIPEWSASGYLEMSRWIFAPVFHWMAAHQVVLAIVNVLNIWGLIFIGLGLMLGLFTRFAAFGGMALLAMYWAANPPLIGMDFGVAAEGNYLVIDKNFVEFLALGIVLLFPTGAWLGLDRLLASRQGKRVVVKWSEARNNEPSPALTCKASSRRDMVKGLASLPFLGAFTFAVITKKKWMSHEEENLADAVTSATIKTFDFSSMADLKGTVPHARIGNESFSRMILGGNLIGGWAHARDLIYVSKLVKAYHHRDKVFETMLTAEKCGINALLTNPILCGIITEYQRQNIGKMKFISDCGGADLLERTQMSIDNGAAACYVQGETADRLVANGDIELIGKAVELVRQNGLPAGIGGHYLSTIVGCAQYGLEPDFWMKTFHHTDYWSSRGNRGEHDNIFCREPEATADFMRNLRQPWIAFKVLAAGAIEPQVGFRQAFENGADFICVGMYDFQVVDNVNTLLTVLDTPMNRRRPWMA